MLRQLEEKDRHSVYLREIALLMEENEQLKGKIREQQKLIDNYGFIANGKKDE